MPTHVSPLDQTTPKPKERASDTDSRDEEEKRDVVTSPLIATESYYKARKSVEEIKGLHELQINDLKDT